MTGRFQRNTHRDTYTAQKDTLKEQLTLLRLEQSQARGDALDVEGLLNFAEHVLTNAATVWNNCEPKLKQRFQEVLFPDGVTFDGREFGTSLDHTEST